MSDKSIEIIMAAQRRLNQAADIAGRGTDSAWMLHADYIRACMEYDFVMDRIPEWADARRIAKASAR